ncbi:viral replication protein [Andean potato mild mosaic virus]|uniref:Non-structural replication polyprotein n=1 Tax=Andean potato mild mosaic virus TaxID=1296569 RepID=M1RFM5_9VIRU|nr:viral replication protein [Andean potato mild mosaic virus]AGG15961.1 viral replication protein [Andean potato mild mosaic virus]
MSFQTALEALNSTTHRDASTNPILNAVVEPLRDSLSQYPWLLPKESLPLLLSWGIPNSGLGTTPHPHPIHKTVETFMLFNHWLYLARIPSTVMFMKPSKFSKLRLLNDNFTTLINFRLTAADTTRYPETSLSYPTTECCFMHDALMYFSPAQILTLFSESPNLQTLYCSLVVPPESHFTDLSLLPEVYSYQISGNTLHYIPESHHSGAYNQPLQALSWLKVASISHSSLQLSVTKLESWGPVHSILIQRGLPPKPSRNLHPRVAPTLLRSNPSNNLLQSTALLFNNSEPQDNLVSFRIPDCLELPSATFLNQPLRHRLIPTAVYNALFTYTRAVRTLRTSDPAGFVRTQSNKAEYSWVTPNAWDNLQTFALLNSPHRPSVSYQFFLSPFKQLQLHFSQHWRTYLLALSPFLSSFPLVPLVMNLNFPIPTPRLLSAFHHHHQSPSTLIVRPFSTGPFQPQLSLPYPEKLARLVAFLHQRNLLPKPPFVPKIEWKRRSLVSFIPKPNIVLPTISTALLSTPLLLKFFHSLTPQQLHDRYHLNLHPPKFQLSWYLQEHHVSNLEPFLPYPLLPIPPVDHSHPTPRPLAFPRINPELHQLNPPQESQPQNSDLASSSSISSIPLSTRTVDHSPITIAPTEPRSQRAIDDASPSPEPDPSNSLEPPIPASISTVLPSGALTFESSPIPSTCLNSTPEPSTAHSSLSEDPTAVGLAKPFSMLFPADYFPMSAEFITRVRHVPSSQLPMPKLNCLLTSFSALTFTPVAALWDSLQSKVPDSLLSNPEIESLGMSTDLLTVLCYVYHVHCILHAQTGVYHYGIASSSQVINLHYEPGPPSHFSTTPRVVASRPHSNPGNTPLVRSALRFKYNGHYLPFHQAHSHETSLMHAKNLISNMKNGFDGILSTITTSKSGPSPRERITTLDSLIDVSSPRQVSVIHIAGFAGCGKTHPIQQLLKTKPFHDFRISTPTNELRSEWKRDMAPSPENLWRFSTWESSLLKSSQILVIDEIYKLPRGYLDLSILSDPSLQLVIILGDPLQGEYHSTSPHSSNHFLPSEVQRLRTYIDCYCWWTYRLPTVLADLFGVNTFNQEKGFVRALSSHPPNSKNLTNAINTATSLQQMGHHAITISSSQGITFNEPHTILLDRHTNLLSPNNCLVALTRSKIGVNFVGALQLASNSFGTNYMFSQALCGGFVDLAQIFPYLMPSLPKLHEPIKSRNQRFVAGHSFFPVVNRRLLLRSHLPVTLPPHIPLSHTKDHLISNPVVLGSSLDSRLETNHLPPTRLPLHFDLEPSIPSQPTSQSISILFPTPCSPGIYGETFENLAAFFLPAHDPDIKEVLHGDLKSNQFPYLDQPFHLSCQPSSLLAPVHSPARDPTLLTASIKKRLRFRPSLHPYQFTPNDQLLGSLLFNSLCRAYNRNPASSVPFDSNLFAECICINEYAQLSSKTRATIVANHQRSDPDWRHCAVRIFAKAQHKVNDGSIFSNWKACQTLALMHDYVILVLGPVKKYQRVFDSLDRPSHIYYHCGHTPTQLSQWCQQHLKHSSYTTNDYTAFDQSQHGEAVILECLKMQRLNIPPFLISLHSTLKRNVSTQFGPLTCMRLTGEPGTYDDNSDYNLAVIYSQYSLSANPILISGDDSVIAGSPLVSPSWPQIEPLLHLRFKTEHTKYPLFCGYYLSPLGAARNPFALFAKLMICVDDGSLEDKKLSYLSEFSVGHLSGDCIQAILPPSLIKYQSACHDFFCRNCTPSQKILLSLDPIPENKILQLLLKVRWASQAFFSYLPQKARELLISRSSLPSLHSDPKISLLESELLPFFN